MDSALMIENSDGIITMFKMAVPSLVLGITDTEYLFSSNGLPALIIRLWLLPQTVMHLFTDPLGNYPKVLASYKGASQILPSVTERVVEKGVWAITKTLVWGVVQAAGFPSHTCRA